MGNSYHNQVRTGELHGWHVYVLSEEGGEYSKIGSATNIKYRVSGLRNGNPRDLSVACDWHFTGRAGARAVEARALKLAGSKRIPGRDWLRATPEQAIELVETAISDLAARSGE